MYPRGPVNLVGVESEVRVFLHGQAGDDHRARAACMCLAALSERFGGRGNARTRICPHAKHLECGRHEFLPNGARAYWDHGYLEYATPACTTTSEALAAVRAGDALIREAVSRLQQILAEDITATAVRNNMDHRGHSFGSHVNIRMTRRGYDRIFDDPAVLNGFVIPFFVSLPVLCGSGRCSSEEGENVFQIWQRGDFLRSLVGLQTTYDRPLVNSRDEALAADPDRYARFHVIAFDANRMELAEYLKLGLLRLLCAAIDADRIDKALELDDPIAAIRSVSRRFSMPLRLASNKTVTALEIQREFLAALVRVHEQNGFADRVPDAAEILAQWEETLACLEKDPFSLVGSLDWITKYAWLEQIRGNENLDWSGPQMRWSDIQYHCLTGGDAPTFPCTRITTDEQIDALTLRPPRLSRAAIRGELLRRFADEIAEANWHWLASSDGKTAYLLPDDPTPDIVQGPEGAKTLKEAAASLGLAAVHVDSRERVSAYADEVPRKESDRKEAESMAAQP